MLIVAVIEAPFKLIEVGRQMFHAHLMIGSDNTALEKRPHAFHAIRVNVPAYPFFGAMVYALVLRIFVLDSDVSLILIRHNALGFVSNHFLDKAVKDFLCRFLSTLDSQVNVSAALNGSEYHRLVSDISASDVTALPADIRFIHFHGPLEHFWTHFLDSLADAMAEIPRCLITYFQLPLEL